MNRIIGRGRRGRGRKGDNGEAEAASGQNGGIDHEAPLLTEQDHKELLSLMLNQNISMDFILEMKEAFQLFDKVQCSTYVCV